MKKSEISCVGRCDGIGNDTPHGSYVRIVITNTDSLTNVIISEGAADLLAAELLGALAQKDNAVLGLIFRNSRGVS